jgi:predicted porin
MNFKLKTLTLALSSLATMSFADVTLYGKVAAGIENDQFQGYTNKIPSSSVQDYGSYFGIRGIDPVYGKTSAIWQVEQYLDIASGQAYSQTTASNMIVPRNGSGNGHVNREVNVLASSETYIGLQGELGRVRLGNISNFMRGNMGNVDIYNYGNGVNGLGTFSRTNKLIPTSIRYDSPTWMGFSVMSMYGFNSNGLNSASAVSGANNFGEGLDGYYSGGIWSTGINWSYSNWSVALGTTIWENVGTYSTATNGLAPNSNYPNSSYTPAYANRLELAYNNPTGLLVGVGFQTTSGMAWNSWPNSGGTVFGVTGNSGYQNQANIIAMTKAIQTQEVAASLGYHLGQWTPKIGYAHGANWMRDGNVGAVIDGSAEQIANTGYDQFVVELDWSLTPRTLAFVNFGQVFYGDTLSNITMGSNAGIVDGNNQYSTNQSTVAVGFSHTF